MNDQEVLSEVAPPRTIHLAHPEYRLGIGAFNDLNQTVLRYRNLQVRMLEPHQTTPHE